ncbi:MAG: lamin tail domain-containing protein [Planctomycetota bacterium]|nr:lamin tail domain-containing protein [Planctomycetota bacterium]
MESRLMLATDPVITEFMANNKRTLKDRFGEYSDWIEIHNPHASTINLAGWYLTDKTSDLTQWEFPAKTIAGGDYLVVFASGRDLRVAGQELHTNFQLSADGGFLALVKPDATTIVSQYGPGYPQQVADISYGVTTGAATSNVLGLGTPASAMVPTVGFSGDWTDRTYNDSTWQHGTTGVGFDATTGEAPPTTSLFYGQFGTGNTWNLYEVVPTASSWANAYNNAQSKLQEDGQGNYRRGHLVTIGNAAENTFVQSILSADSWIGFTDDAAYGTTEGSFVWVTGEATSYTKWEGGQPNNTSSGQTPANFTIIKKSSAAWGDFGTNATYASVIEYDLNLAQTPTDTAMPYRFSVVEAYGPKALNNIDDAVNLLATGGGTRFTYARPVINYVKSGTSDGHFTGGASFNGIGTTGQSENFAVQVSGVLRILNAGKYTFGVNSDDGFSLTIDGATFTSPSGSTGTTASGDTLAFEGSRSANDSFGVADLSAGEHRIELTYYQGASGAALELFAAAGEKTTFDSTFKLVGDTGAGGLSLVGIKDSIGTGIRSTMYNTNTSAYIRVPFEVTDVTAIPQLTLRMKYDDGFVAYINGHEVARSDSAPASLAWNSKADWEGLDSEALIAEDFDVTSAIPFLVNGTNVLAIQALNVAANDPDLYVMPTLEAKSAPVVSIDGRYFVAPTPWKLNSTGTVDLGPIITDLTQLPVAPVDADNVTITAKVRKGLNAVSSVALHYRVFAVTNETEVDLPMLDDGAHGDGAAGDGVYAAVIPSSAGSAGQLVRYYMTANDSASRTSRRPLIPATDPDPAGKRKWPEYEGYMIPDSAVTSSMPIIYWFVKNANAASYSRTGTRGSVWYNGEFYDNVFFRSRGGSATGGTKVQFNRGYQFRWDPDQPRIADLDLNFKGGLAPDGAWIRPVITFETLRDAGCPSSVSYPWRLQINGQYGSVRIFVEEPEEGYLERAGLYADGTLYKTPNSDNGQIPSATYFEKKNPDDANFADLQAFLDGIHQSDLTAKQNFVIDNLDIPRFVDYQVGIVLTESLDAPQKNYFLYQDTNNLDNPNGTNLWMILPWDAHLTFGKSYGIPDYQAKDPQAHPFFGDSSHPKIDGSYAWNYLIDAALDTPVVKQIYLRHLRTAMDQLLQPNGTPYSQRYMENRLDELYNVLMGDAAFKAEVGDLKTEFDNIKDLYLTKKRDHLYIDHSQNTSYPDYAGIPTAQPDHPQISFGAYEYNPASKNQDQEYIELRNPNNYAVDISDWHLDRGVDYHFPKGTVIPANTSIYLSPNLVQFKARTTGPKGGQGLLVTGPYKNHLSARGETVRLLDASHTPVTWFSYAPTPSAAQNALRVTEVMYNPAADPTKTFPDNEDFEFIELQNISNQTLNLNGVRFTAGIDFTFGSVDLPAHQYIVVVRNRAAFESRYGAGTASIAGEYGLSAKTSLDNGGDRIQIVDANGEVIQDFTYDPNWQWSTNGLGRSLVVKDAPGDLGNWGLAAGWRPSAFNDGSPGAADPEASLAAPTVNIMHLEPETRPSAVDSMTIVFSEAVTGLDLSDLKLTRDGATTDLLTGSHTLTKTDAVTWVLGGLGGITAASGQYLLTLTPQGSGIVDLDSNALAAGDDEGFTVDPGVPTGSISPAVPDPRTTPVNAITFTFSKAVVGFDLGDLRLTRDGVELLLTASQTLTSGNGGVTWVLGGLTSLTTANATYELTLDPDNSGILDAATGTKHLAGKAVESFKVGVALPTVRITAATPDPRNTPVAKITIVFSKQITNFTVSNLSLVRDTTSILLSSATLSQGADTVTWTLANLSSLTDADGQYTFTLNPAGITDTVGTPLAAGASESFEIDKVRPTMTISAVTPDPRNTSVPFMTITFSEPVQDFTRATLSLTRDGVEISGGSLNSTDNITFKLAGLGAVTALEGKYTLTMPSIGEIIDSAGNALISGSTETFTVDKTAPTVSMTPVNSDPHHGPVAYIDIVFSEPVVGFDISDLELARDGGANLLSGQNALAVIDQQTCRLSTTNVTKMLGSYELRLKSSGNGITDRAGNPLAGGASESFVMDTITGNGDYIGLIRDVDDPKLLRVYGGPEPSYTVLFESLPQIQILADRRYPANLLALNFANGNMLPAAGLRFDGESPASKGHMLILGSGNADVITVSPGLMTFGGVPIEFVNVAAISIDTAAGAGAVTVRGSLPTPVTVSGDGEDAVTVDDASVVFDTSRRIGSLTLTNGGRLSLAHAISFLHTRSLSLSNGGTLDLNGGDLIVQTDGTQTDAVLAQVNSWVQSGRSNGWQGTGITSSMAKATSMTTLAVMLNSSADATGPIYAEFDGQSVDANAILVKYTWDGDANLDGLLNADDYFLVDSGYITQAKDYANGDFNYDGVINADDYFLIDSAFIGQTSQMAAGGPDVITATTQPRKAEVEGILAELFSTEPVV